MAITILITTVQEIPYCKLCIYLAYQGILYLFGHIITLNITRAVTCLTGYREGRGSQFLFVALFSHSMANSVHIAPYC